MRTVLIIFSILLCSTTSVQSQWWGNGKKIPGNGQEITKIRNVSEYDQIKVSDNLEVLLVAGKEGKITILGESNLIPHIITDVSEDVLKIDVEKGYYLKPSHGNKIKITVPFNTINLVTLSGSGDIIGKDIIKSDNFKTGVSGSGDVRLKIEVENGKSYINGSGNVVLSGSSNNFEAKISGSGDIEAFDLVATNVAASVTGSGDIEITATTSLKARITGSGNIYYQGNPQKEDTKISGSGNITKK